MKKNIVVLIAMAVLVPQLAFAQATTTGTTGTTGKTVAAKPAHHSGWVSEDQRLHRTRVDNKNTAEYKRLHPGVPAATKGAPHAKAAHSGVAKPAPHSGWVSEDQRLHRTRVDNKNTAEYKRLHPGVKPAGKAAGAKGTHHK